MDYKEKYEKALNAARKFKNDCPSLWDAKSNPFRGVFEELEDTEDEKIRKDIIEYLEQSQFGEEHYQIDDDIVRGYIAWLEKQGEKIYVIENFDTEFEKQVSYLIASAINKEHEYNQDYVKWTANALLNYAKHELEKQGEQKLVNKVKPKFKIGDIISNNESRVEIIGINEQKYIVSNVEIDNDANIVNWFIPFENQSEWKLIEQKSTESEKDEKMLDKLIKHFSWNDSMGFTQYECNEAQSWLKSIKERIKL